MNTMPQTTHLALSELIGALSHALDLTEGQPPGHCVRCAWIGVHVGRALGLSEPQLRDVYYTLLLKDLGCSSNAARICELYLTDDHTFKSAYKHLDGTWPPAIRFVLEHSGLGGGLVQRFRTMLQVFQHGSEWGVELMRTRCTRGAEIALQLRFGEDVADGIRHLDEHWDGGGKPEGLTGTSIHLNARIALLAQVVDVFRTAAGPLAALEEVRRRRGGWFDPDVVDALEQAVLTAGFWEALDADDLDARVVALEPLPQQVVLDEDYLDEIAVGFGLVVDAKSPYTAGHSTRVATYADQIAAELGLSPDRRRWLKRGALLHDLGKLGVSNLILDKPGKLDADEWTAVKRHAAFTHDILGRLDAFGELAHVSAAHHERLDGTGYPLGLDDRAISLETRIITTADIFDAITAERPYRGAIPVDRALDMMRAEVGTAIDPRCFAALERILGV